MISPKFTICIPTWNRGHVALRQVLHTLPLIEPDWELLVLDNCSTANTEGYREIESLSMMDHRVRYVKHAENLGFHGNILASIKLAKSAYLQIISDEDYSNPKTVQDAIATLDEFPEVGLIRGSIGPIAGMVPRNSVTYADQFLTAGRHALGDFSFTNYVSGIIYNKKLLEFKGIAQKFEVGLSCNPMIAVYAHVYLDILISASCAVISSGEIVCFEGEELSYAPDTKAIAETFPYTFAGRLEQVIGFRDAFREVCSPDQLNDLSLLMHLYIRLVHKYCTLFHIDSFLYVERGLSLGALSESMRYFFIAACEIDEFLPVLSVVHDMVHERFELVCRHIRENHDSNIVSGCSN
jgi:glycosyltransferase involved in cell wall biosynthesis